MKVHYISDLHVDFWVRETNPQSPKADVLIIAGDLGHYNHQDQAFLLKCKEVYKHIMFVRGNHDMYLISNRIKNKFLFDSMNRVNEMKRFCRENGIHYLDGNVISIDGYNFGGVGMSWDDSYYIKLASKDCPDYNPSKNEVNEFFKNTMNDAKLIYGGSDNFDVQTAYGGRYFESSFNQNEYFECEYKKLQNINDYDNIDIMVSHYIPIVPYEFSYSSYEDSSSSTFYMFDGYKDVERINPKYWIFGHMHSEYDFNYKDVNFLCNPLGYPGEYTFGKVREIELI
jgi:Icc-related predicted phosphoesterase